ncbi:hypothetical protein GGR21_002916 [Dysgonomonas hofstadii]|uniref:Uncharacterized protein n=1 Tax=Dysgonomonas hofstadii TaxID=637886 RepID=A0A840CX35_9BACT|nr:hypothetical protein [Dysgonomonas hofstadii]MBB4037002.1 hypothetical protein [Dysgonomonas hofstadii]
MRNRLYRFYLFLVIVVAIAFPACRTKMMYVPVESVRTEYQERIIKDSLHLYDSVFVKLKGDTVWLEKYKYLYRDRFLRDSVFKTDSIQIPYPVEVEREINRLTSFQSFQLWCGRILILLFVGLLGIRWMKKDYINK